MKKDKIKNYELAEIDYHEGMSYETLAEKYKVTINTVKSWKRRYCWSNKGPKVKRTQKSKKVSKSPKSNKKKTDTIKDSPKPFDFEKDLKSRKITDKQKLFCIYYVRTYNAVRSYMKAYNCSYESAAPLACKLLKKDNIQKEIENLKKSSLANKLIKEEDILEKHIQIAFADIFDADGTVLTEVKAGPAGTTMKIDRAKSLKFLTEHYVSGAAIDNDGIENFKRALAPTPEDISKLYEDEDEVMENDSAEEQQTDSI